MRSRSLESLTSLPLEAIRRQFRNEEVRSVLPAGTGAGRTDSLLVATTTALAIVTADPKPRSGGWLTRWAPWDVVRLSDGIEPLGAPTGDEYHLAVEVDRLRFEAHLLGDTGLRAMRDFVAVSQERRSTLSARP